MAKIKFGMMMTDARGKLGGQVFSKNRSGAYVRTKVTPVNPRTISQQENRGIFGNISSGWSVLTEAQRTAWNKAVDQWQKTNIFGDLQKPTGKNLFTGLNKVRRQMFPALPVQNEPPRKLELPAILIADAFYSVENNNLAVELTGGFTTGDTVQVRATPVVSDGTTFVKNLLRVVGAAVTVPEGGVITVGALYAEKFGTPSAGQKLFVEVSPVAENGQLGVPVTTAVIAIP